jgi:predicted DNA-binding protein
MYTYIMERTQIYLTRRESTALAQLAKQTGRTRSQLIREAITAQYLAGSDPDAATAALEATAGLWADRTETGAAYVRRIRSGRLERRLQAR